MSTILKMIHYCVIPMVTDDTNSVNKERINELLEVIDSFLVEEGGKTVTLKHRSEDHLENWDAGLKVTPFNTTETVALSTPRDLLEFIKKDLGRLNWDAEEKVGTLYLGFLERFEKVLELIDNFEKEGSYTPLPLIREIKEVLENDTNR